MRIHFFILVIFLIQITLKFILEDFGYVNTVLSQIFVVFIPVCVYLIASEKRVGRYFEIENRKVITDVIITVLTVVSVNILSLYLNYPIIKIMKLENPILQKDNSIYELVIGIFVLCLVPAIFEELLFRGILLEEFIKKHSLIKASILSSLLFAMIHFDIINIFPQFIIGLLLCYIALSSKSVLLPIIAHFSNNLFSLLFGNDMMEYFFQNGIPVFILALVVCTGGVVYFKSKTSRREI